MSMPSPRNDNEKPRASLRATSGDAQAVAPAVAAAKGGGSASVATEPAPAAIVFKNAALVLGALATVGPMAIDMYLPAFPAIAQNLNVDVGQVQLSLVSFFFALVVGQLFYGPISDAIGRKKPLYAGLTVFVLGSIGCSMAQSVEMLIFMRFVQGLGACAGMVLSRAIVRDIHTGREAVRLISLMMLVLSVSPMLAPLAGSLLSGSMSWRGIFIVTAGLGVFGGVLMWKFLPETRPPERRSKAGMAAALQAYKLLAVDRRFIGMAMVCGCAQGVMMSYLTGSSFAFIEVYRVSPFFYSAVFATNAMALIGCAQLNATLISRIGLERLIRLATLGLGLFTSSLAVLTFAGLAPLPVFWGLLFLTFGTLGMISPTSAVLALEPHGARAGAASSMLGGMQFASATVAGGVVALLFNGTLTPLVIALAVCGLGAAVMARLTLRRRPVAKA